MEACLGSPESQFTWELGVLQEYLQPAQSAELVALSLLDQRR